MMGRLKGLDEVDDQKLSLFSKCSLCVSSDNVAFKIFTYLLGTSVAHSALKTDHERQSVIPALLSAAGHPS
jgi:hypothetical protein